MSLYTTAGSLQRLRDQSLMADYATDNSTPWHLDQFRKELTRLLAGAHPQASDEQCRGRLKSNILEELSNAGLVVRPDQVDGLIERLINTPLNDKLPHIRPTVAIAAE